MRHAERRAERRAGWDAAWHAETSRRPRRGSKTKPVEACARDPWLDRRAAHRGGSIAIDDRDAPQLRPAASMSHLFRGPIILMNHASTRTPPGDWERSWRSVPASCALAEHPLLGGGDRPFGESGSSDGSEDSMVRVLPRHARAASHVGEDRAQARCVTDGIACFVRWSGGPIVQLTVQRLIHPCGRTLRPLRRHSRPGHPIA